jgi:hypothetical protein
MSTSKYKYGLQDSNKLSAAKKYSTNSKQSETLLDKRFFEMASWEKVTSHMIFQAKYKYVHLPSDLKP